MSPVLGLESTTITAQKQYEIHNVAANTSLCSLLETRRDSPGPRMQPSRGNVKAEAQRPTH
jgi:hypothetical protein